MILAIALLSAGREISNGQSHTGDDHPSVVGFQHELDRFRALSLRAEATAEAGLQQGQALEVCPMGCAIILWPPLRATPDSVRDEIMAQFRQGYRDAAGPRDLDDHFIEWVIPCESSWRLDPEGYHLGLAQFDPGTWRLARRSPSADYRDPYEQGWAVARWLATGIDPGSTAGWPYCWHR